MAHDPIVNTFWPRLYEVYPDFQLWVARRQDDGRAGVHGAGALGRHPGAARARLGADATASPASRRRCARSSSRSSSRVPRHGARARRSCGGWRASRRRTGSTALIAPVRPTWKERYPLTPIERYVLWRREDGLPYDPWLRTHERLGAEVLDVAPRSMTITGSRDEWEEWTGLQFPEDGDYVVPGALVPVRFENGARHVRRAERLDAAPARRLLAAAALRVFARALEAAAHLAVRRLRRQRPAPPASRAARGAPAASAATSPPAPASGRGSRRCAASSASRSRAPGSSARARRSTPSGASA